MATGIGPFLWGTPQSRTRFGSDSVGGGGDPSPTTFRRADGEAALLSCRPSHAWDRTRLCPVYRNDERRINPDSSFDYSSVISLVLAEEKRATSP